MRSRFVGCLIIFLLHIVPSGARASEECQLLTSQGLLEFGQENYAEAHRLFDRAVEVYRDEGAPGTLYTALYYRGVTAARLERYDEAVADLTRAHEYWPDKTRVQIELGIARISADLCDATSMDLVRVPSDDEDFAAASFYLALCELRNGRYADAAATFELAAASDKTLTLSTSYYRGVASYRRGRLPEALCHFEQTISLGPGSTMAAEAAKYVEIIEAETFAARPYIQVGFEYDSNVALAPTEGIVTAVTNTDKGDGRFTIAAGARTDLLRRGARLLQARYGFFQSIHFDRDEFNLQNHQLNFTATERRSWYEFGLQAQYEFFLLEADRLAQQPMVSPWLGIRWENLGATRFFYGFRWRDYFDRRFSEELDALRHSIGARHRLTLDDVLPGTYEVGYAFDRNGAVHPRGRPFAFDRHELSASGQWQHSATGLIATAEYRIHWESYDSPSNGRRDQRNSLVLGLRQRLWDRWEFHLGYRGGFNESNQSIFEYWRHVASFAVTARFQ